MTKEELKKKAKEYARNHKRFYTCSGTPKIVTSEEEVEHAYRTGFNAGYSDGYEVGKENEQLKKSVIVWHKITCFAEPDENGCITADNPAEEGKEYLLKTKYGFAIGTLEYDETGFFFSDYDWKNIVAWAELPSAV